MVILAGNEGVQASGTGSVWGSTFFTACYGGCSNFQVYL